MKYEIQMTSHFKKDYKLAIKRGCDINLLMEVVRLLAHGKQLPDQYHDHPLSGNYKGYRDCHLQPDWLLVYKITESLLVLTLYRTGSHNDLFL